MITFTADDAIFDVLIGELSDTPGILEDVSVVLAEEAISLVREGFDEQASPYGKGWAAKKQPDGRAILVGKTGRTRTGWKRVRANASGFKISASTNYSGYLQDGTTKMVHRKMVPDGDVPPKWDAAFREVAQDVLDEHLGGR